jgi:carbonic anhydrase
MTKNDNNGRLKEIFSTNKTKKGKYFEYERKMLNLRKLIPHQYGYYISQGCGRV